MWDPQDTNPIINPAAATAISAGTDEVSNGISIGMAAMDSLLHQQSPDQDDEILHFPSHAGTFSTPKPAGGYFQPHPPEPIYLHSENGNYTLADNDNTAATTPNGLSMGMSLMDTLDTSQPYQSSLVHASPMEQQQQNPESLANTFTSVIVEPPSAPEFSHTPLTPQQIPETPNKTYTPEPGSTGTPTPAPQLYKCNHCEKRFRDMAKLNMHTRKTHPESVPPEESDPEPDPEVEDSHGDAATDSDANEKADADADTTYTVHRDQDQDQENEQNQTQMQNNDNQKQEEVNEDGEQEQNSPQGQDKDKGQSHQGHSLFCDLCNTSYGSYSHLKRHFGTVMHRNNVKSQNLNPQNSTNPKYKEDKHKGKDLSEYKCDVCDVSFTDTRNLRRHFLTATHQQKLRASTGTGEEDEDVGYGTEAQTQETQDSSTIGTRRHSQRQRQPPARAGSPAPSLPPRPRPFKCEVCNLDFDYQRGLDRHRTTKTHLLKCGDVDRGMDTGAYGDADFAYEFECENCAVSFPSAGDLEHHYLTAHLSLSQEEIKGPAPSFGESISLSATPKKLSCDVCGFRFKDSYHLRRHFMSQSHQRKMEEQEQHANANAFPEVVLEKGEDENEDQEYAPAATGAGGIFHCESCNTTYRSAKQIKRHYATAMHKQNFAAASRGSGPGVGGSASEDDDGESETTDGFRRDCDQAQAFLPMPITTPVRTSITAKEGANDPKRHFKCDVCNTYYLTCTHLRRHFTTNSHLAMVDSGGAAAEIRIALPAPARSKAKSAMALTKIRPSTSLSTCSVCSKMFSNWEALNSHMKQDHQELQQEEEDEDDDHEIKQESSEQSEEEGGHDQDTGDDESASAPGARASFTGGAAAAGDRGRLVCEVCNASYRGSYDLQRHFGTLIHRTNLANLQGISVPCTSSSSLPQAKSKSKSKNKSKARSMNEVVGLGHFLGSYPPSAVAAIAMSRSSLGKNSSGGKPKCEVCKKFYCSNKDLRKHYLTRIHQQMVAELAASRSRATASGPVETEEEDAESDHAQEENENESEQVQDQDLQSRNSSIEMDLGHIPLSHGSGAIPRKRARLACETCGTTYQGLRDLERHYGTQKHLAAVNEGNKMAGASSNSASAASDTSGRRPGPKSKTHSQYQYKCNTCETSYDTTADLEQHKETSSHLTAVRIYLESENKPNGSGGDGEGEAGTDGDASTESVAGGEVD